VDVERHRRAKAIFAEALEMEAGPREGYLDQACAGDAALRSEVESLLAAAGKSDGFLDAVRLPPIPAQSLSPALGGPDVSVEPEPRTRIGPWRLVREVGRGGMGSVYLVERSDREYRGVAALKLVKRGMDTDFILRRFRAERQILASLSHPNIARLLDGGTTEDGLPYFVMEYIEGESLTEHCRSRNLPLRDRIALFRTVCGAVQFAHRSLVVHRDIKPSNVMVDTGGAVKLLDFGLAKVLDPERGGDSSYLTVAGIGIFTPEYASPEQVKGEAITTATDVYSLGVVLYELLAGRHPFRDEAADPAELLRLVREADPFPPSAAARSGEPDAKRRSHQLRGDLDTIVMTALRKEPGRRYATVEKLSADLGRHLSGLPVSARPDTLVYRTGKFIRRHRLGVGASLLVALSLVAGLSAAVWEARIARQVAATSRKRYTDLRSLANALITDLNRDFERVPGATAARAALVKRAVEYLDRLSADSGGDVGLKRDLAAGYEQLADLQGGPNTSLGDREGAIASYRKALTFRESIAGGPEATVADRLALAKTLAGLSAVLPASAEMIDVARRAVAIGETALQEAPADTKVRRSLAILYHGLAGALSEQGDYRGALDPRRREVALFDDIASATPRDANALRNAALGHKYLAGQFEKLGEFDEAERHFRLAVDFDNRQTAIEGGSFRARLDLAHSLGGLATTLMAKKAFEPALEASRRGSALSAEVAAADPGNAVALIAALRAECRTGTVLTEMNRLDESAALFRTLAGRAEALVAKGTARRDSSLLLAQVYGDLGTVLARQSERPADAARREILRRAARNALRRSEQTWVRLDAEAALPAWERENLDGVRRLLQSLAEP
jgi:tetratricopeptide (TPR) repeat protein